MIHYSSNQKTKSIKKPKELKCILSSSYFKYQIFNEIDKMSTYLIQVHSDY